MKVTLLGLLTVLGAVGSVSVASAGADCHGPFVSQKYPFPHAVLVNPETRCYSKWVVSEQSPEDVRCIFTYVDHVPSSAPDVSMTLSQEAYDHLITTATTQGQTNTAGFLGDRYVFVGFRNDLTPTAGTPGCH